MSPGLQVVLGHICLAVGLEQVWGRIDECVPVCVSAYMSHMSVRWDKKGARQSPVRLGI